MAIRLDRSDRPRGGLGPICKPNANLLAECTFDRVRCLLRHPLADMLIQIDDAAVFWPADDDPLSRFTGTGIFGDPVPTSDHRLAWVDVTHGALSGN